MKKVFLIALLSTSVCLSGCAALVIGGAAATGYAVNKDERTARQVADDASITTAITTKFLADKYVQGLTINVDTYNRVVTLNGTANSRFSIERAEAMARATRGVLDVKNNLRVPST